MSAFFASAFIALGAGVEFRSLAVGGVVFTVLTVLFGILEAVSK